MRIHYRRLLNYVKSAQKQERTDDLIAKVPAIALGLLVAWALYLSMKG